VCNLTDWFSKLIIGIIQLNQAPICHTEIVELVPVNLVASEIVLNSVVAGARNLKFNYQNPAGIVNYSQLFAQLDAFLLRQCGTSLTFLPEDLWFSELMNLDSTNVLFPLKSFGKGFFNHNRSTDQWNSLTDSVLITNDILWKYFNYLQK
jgi:hypothetical protein